MPRWLLAAFVSLCLPLSALAGPPIQTDDTGTPGPGNWEANIGITAEKRRDVLHYETPLDLNYGIGERVQLNYSVSWIVLDPKDEAARSGLGNSELAVKWRFLDEEKHGVAVSVYPRFIFNNPTGSADRGLVNDGTVFRLPLQMEKKIGVMDVIANAGHEFHQEGSDAWLYSVAVKYAGVKGLEALAEVFGSADNEWKNAESACNIGLRKDVSDNYTVMASLGRSLREGRDHPALLSYVGVQGRF